VISLAYRPPRFFLFKDFFFQVLILINLFVDSPSGRDLCVGTFSSVIWNFSPPFPLASFSPAHAFDRLWRGCSAQRGRGFFFLFSPTNYVSPILMRFNALLLDFFTVDVFLFPPDAFPSLDGAGVDLPSILYV